MANERQEQSGNHSDFSIDHILNRAGNNYNKKSQSVEEFPWLQCSRYCPPKVPRIHKKDIQKRQLGRHPRIPFTSQQLCILEEKFKERPYLSSEEVVVLSKKLQLADIRVKIWFQNRRARDRREKTGQHRRKEEKKTPEDSRCIDSKVLELPVLNRKSNDSHNTCNANRQMIGMTSNSILNRNITELLQETSITRPYFITDCDFFVPNVANSQNIMDKS